MFLFPNRWPFRLFSIFSMTTMWLKMLLCVSPCAFVWYAKLQLSGCDWVVLQSDYTPTSSVREFSFPHNLTVLNKVWLTFRHCLNLHVSDNYWRWRSLYVLFDHSDFPRLWIVSPSSLLSFLYLLYLWEIFKYSRQWDLLVMWIFQDCLARAGMMSFAMLGSN